MQWDEYFRKRSNIIYIPIQTDLLIQQLFFDICQ